MILASTGGFVLVTLSVLASGYIIYDAPLLRWWLPKSTGYVLYFRILTTGLLLTFFLGVLLYTPMLHNVSILGLQLNPEFSPVMAFPVALGLRALVKGVTFICGKCQPQWKVQLKIQTLNEKGLDQFIFERILNKKMIMVTLENKKVYAGWPIEAPGNEDNQWLRFTPQWSGYRDADSKIIVETDYSKVLDTALLTTNRMLISVEKIVTVQPFDEEIFQKFNPAI